MNQERRSLHGLAGGAKGGLSRVDYLRSPPVSLIPTFSGPCSMSPSSQASGTFLKNLLLPLPGPNSGGKHSASCRGGHSGEGEWHGWWPTTTSWPERLTWEWLHGMHHGGRDQSHTTCYHLCFRKCDQLFWWHIPHKAMLTQTPTSPFWSWKTFWKELLGILMKIKYWWEDMGRIHCNLLLESIKFPTPENGKLTGVWFHVRMQWRERQVRAEANERCNRPQREHWVPAGSWQGGRPHAAGTETMGACGWQPHLGSGALVGSIFQQILYNIDVVLLGSHIQRSEAILRTDNKKDIVSHLWRLNQGREQDKERENVRRRPLKWWHTAYIHIEEITHDLLL